MTISRNTFLSLLTDAKSFIEQERHYHPFVFTQTSFAPLAKKAPTPSIPTKTFAPQISASAPKKAPAAETLGPLAQEVEKQPVVTEEPKTLKQDLTLRKLIEKSCPHLHIKDTIPSDEEAIQRKNAWKKREHAAEVLLLHFSKNLSEKKFVENVAKAISISIKSAHPIDALQIEGENGWKPLLDLPNLGWIVAPPLETWKAPQLKSLVVINPASQEAFLGKARIQFVASWEKYLADPLTKHKLWQTLSTLA